MDVPCVDFDENAASQGYCQDSFDLHGEEARPPTQWSPTSNPPWSLEQKLCHYEHEHDTHVHQGNCVTREAWVDTCSWLLDLKPDLISEMKTGFSGWERVIPKLWCETNINGGPNKDWGQMCLKATQGPVSLSVVYIESSYNLNLQLYNQA